MPKTKEKKEELETFSQPLEEGVGEVLASWEFPEHEKPERSRKWYLYFFLIMAGLVILSLFDFNITLFHYADQTFDISFAKNPLFIIILVLFLIIYFYTERKDVQNIQIFFAEEGLILHNRFMPYDDFQSFYLIYHPPKIKNLYLQPKNHFKPLVIIPLEDQNPVAVRNLLLEFIEEDLEKEDIPASEGLTRVLKL